MPSPSIVLRRMANIFPLAGKRVWVAGHTGLVGSALVRRLDHEPCDILQATRAELDLRRQTEVRDWMNHHKPDVIIIAAAKVGGIGANHEFPADFISDNLAIAQNIIDQAARQQVSKLVFLGSSCIYPKFAPQPIPETALLTGALELTNEAYAIAKIAGLKLCQFYRRQHGHDFISLMPCNLYGPGDRWQDAGAHVIPALVKRFHEAKIAGLPSVTIWGSGTPLREFLYVDDLANACVHLLKVYSDELHINVGSGTEISIGDLARQIAEVCAYEGEIVFDRTKPDGTPRKLMDTTRLRATGWVPQTSLEAGLKLAYADFLQASSVL